MSTGTFEKAASTSPFDFRGKVAVVTGATQGIGAAIAEELARGGATVVIGARREPVGSALAERLTEETNGKAEFRRLDVADSASISEAAEAVFGAHGRVDVLVNNAAIAENSPALELDNAAWDRTIATNLTGSFLCAREFGRRMVEGDGSGGAVVNVSSIRGFQVARPEKNVAYDAAKGGMNQMTRTLAAEWAPLGVRVNAVAPGYIDTPALQDVARVDPGAIKEWLSQIPQGRLIQPAEVARAVAFLASDHASAITGQVLLADGGYALW